MMTIMIIIVKMISIILPSNSRAVSGNEFEVLCKKKKKNWNGNISSSTPKNALQNNSKHIVKELSAINSIFFSFQIMF